MRHRLLGLLGLAAAAVCTACGSQASTLPATSARGWPMGDLVMRHAGRDAVRLSVEIADTEPHREAGLMNTRSLPADQGEAFTWPQPIRVGFWMKDTLIPLDIVYWDQQGHIVDILTMQPCSADPCQVYYARAAFAGAVELDPGVVEKAGVQTGDSLTLTRRGPATTSSSG